MTRFFVPNRGVTHQWTAKEMASHDDFVYLDMSATYQTIGSQVVRRSGINAVACGDGAKADTADTCRCAMHRRLKALGVEWMVTLVWRMLCSAPLGFGMKVSLRRLDLQPCYKLRSTMLCCVFCSPRLHGDLVMVSSPACTSAARVMRLSQIAVFEHVVAAHDIAFVLKTDDDSFVNVPAMVADLRARCTTTGCAAEKLYMGYQVLGMRQLPLNNLAPIPQSSRP